MSAPTPIEQAFADEENKVEGATDTLQEPLLPPEVSDVPEAQG